MTFKGFHSENRRIADQVQCLSVGVFQYGILKWHGGNGGENDIRSEGSKGKGFLLLQECIAVFANRALALHSAMLGCMGGWGCETNLQWEHFLPLFLGT